MYFYSPPTLIKNAFSSIVWNSKINKILLTFDDGPGIQSSSAILNKLNKHNLKAIFFVVGKDANKNHELIKDIINENHIIGCHSFNHDRYTFLNPAQYSNEVEEFIKLFEDKFSYRINYFRPPFGHIPLNIKNISNSYSLTTVMWSLFTYDYKNSNNIVKFAIEKYLKNNSIIVFHNKDICKNTTLESIDFLIEEISKKGYLAGEPKECLK